MFVNSQVEVTYLIFSVAQQAVHGPVPGYWNTHIQPAPSFPAGGEKNQNI